MDFSLGEVSSVAVFQDPLEFSTCQVHSHSMLMHGSCSVYGNPSHQPCRIGSYPLFEKKKALYGEQPAVALVFEEMCTPSASGQEICVQKFRNAYLWKKKKKMPHFKSPFTTRFIKGFSKIKRFSQMMRAVLSHTRVCSAIVCVIMFCLRHVETESCFFP